MRAVGEGASPGPREIVLTRAAVLVVDMQNTFWKPGGAFSLLGLDISGTGPTFAAINRLTGVAREIGIPIFWIVTVHERDLSTAGPPSSPWRKKEATFALLAADPDRMEALPFRDAWGVRVVEELEVAPSDRVIEKTRYSGFHHTRLDGELRSLGVEHLVFCGGCTNICLGDTLKDGYRLGYPCAIAAVATRACGAPFAQDAELANIAYCYGWVSSTAELTAAMGRTAAAPAGGPPR